MVLIYIFFIQQKMTTAGTLHTASSFGENDILVLSGYTLLPHQKGINVGTTNKRITELISTMTKQTAKQIYHRVYLCLTKYDTAEAFDKIYDEKGKEWQDFMDDYVIFAVINFVLFKKPIQIFPLNEMDEEWRTRFAACMI